MRCVVIGLGQFGRPTAIELARSGNEVIAIDVVMEDVERIKDQVALAICADATSMATLKSHGIPEADLLVAAIRDDFEAQALVVANAVELGIRNIVARASSETHELVLKAIGAHEVLRPENEAALHLVQQLTIPGIKEYFELSDGFSVVEVKVPEKLAGQALRDLRLRQDFRVNLIGRRRIVRDEATGKERPVFDVAKPNTEPLQQGEELVLIGTDLDLAMMMTTLGFEHDET